MVEDNAFLSEVYVDILKDFNIDVQVAHTGNDGYDLARLGGWDLIIMDIILPNMDGFEVIRKLKDNPPRTPNKAVVFLTSLDSEDEVQRAKELGNGFIKKSDITPGELIEKISPYLNS